MAMTFSRGWRARNDLHLNHIVLEQWTGRTWAPIYGVPVSDTVDEAITASSAFFTFPVDARRDDGPPLPVIKGHRYEDDDGRGGYAPL